MSLNERKKVGQNDKLLGSLGADTPRFFERGSKFIVQSCMARTQDS